MAPSIVTRVLYDVIDAIKNLRKLDKKVEDSAETAEDAFKLGETAAAAYDEIISLLPRNTQKLARAAGNLVVTFGPVGAVMLTAAAGASAVAAQFLDLPSLLRDSAAGMDEFTSAAEGLLEARDLSADIADAFVNADLRRQQEAFRNQDALLDLERSSVLKRKNFLDAEVLASRAAQKEKTEAVRDSVKTREALEKQLADRLAGRKGSEFAGLPADIQSASLLEVAREQAAKGNIESAEALVDQAKALTPELENQIFALGDMETTQHAIDNALRRQIRAAREADSIAKQSLATQIKKTSSLEAEAKILEERNRSITGEKSRLTGLRKFIQEETTNTKQRQGRDTAARAIQSAATIVKRELVDGGRSLKESILDSVKQTSNNLKKGGISDAAGDQIKVGLDALVELDKVMSNGTATIGELGTAISELGPKVATARGTLGTVVEREGLRGFDVDLKQFDRVIKQISNIGKAVILAEESGASRDTIAGVEGTADVFDPFNKPIVDGGNAAATSLQNVGEAANTAAATLNSIGGAQAAPTAAVATPAAVSVAAATAAPQVVEITVNATVQGGVISREVMEDITDLINREVRKATSGGVAS
jgi:tetratricopeptide (TPR) repeat protein